MLLKSLYRLCEIIYEEAEREYTDIKPLQNRLLELSSMLDNGEITEEDFAKEEDEILERLTEIRKYRRENFVEDVLFPYEDTETDENEET